MEVSKLIEVHYQNFNARTLKEAIKSLESFYADGGKILLSLGGAMSTAGLGSLIASSIEEGLVHAISTTGANLEEDLYRYYFGHQYLPVKDWRHLSEQDDIDYAMSDRMRITDTTMPLSSISGVDDILFECWKRADKARLSKFPHEYMFEAIDILEDQLQGQPRTGNSWVKTAMENGIPIFVPGWEDSTEGNSFTSSVIKRDLHGSIMKTGIQYLQELCAWYIRESNTSKMGFLQCGGGIAGDFSICVVPLINEDLEQDVPLWEYFCQISDSTTSYGSYSGAPPSEKITWGKLRDCDNAFMIESDATIVLPLLLGSLLC